MAQEIIPFGAENCPEFRKYLNEITPKEPKEKPQNNIRRSVLFLSLIFNVFLVFYILAQSWIPKLITSTIKTVMSIVCIVILFVILVFLIGALPPSDEIEEVKKRLFYRVGLGRRSEPFYFFKICYHKNNARNIASRYNRRRP